MTDNKLPSSDPTEFKAWEGSSVFVEQGRHWSSVFIWLSGGLFIVTIVLAFVAKLDQTVSVRGLLSPSGSVKDIESPSSGVVMNVAIEDGDIVQKGESLLTVEAKGLYSQLQGIDERRQLLDIEISSLESILDSKGKPSHFKPLLPLPIISDIELSAKMLNARNQTNQIRSQLRSLDTNIASRKKSFLLQQKICEDIGPLFRNGGLSRNAYLQELNKLQLFQAEFLTLEADRTRILGSVSAKVNQLNQQIISLRTQHSILNEQLSYRTVKAPISGTIFDLNVAPYSVVSNSQPLLKIVPDNILQANVEIPNIDIGFIKTGQLASVSIDSFPSGEFGYIDGVLTSIGSDVLPPDSDSPQQYFPATITLKQQNVYAGDTPLNLQSGMSLTANIKLRSRPAITLLTDIFTRQMEGVKRFR